MLGSELPTCGFQSLCVHQFHSTSFLSHWTWSGLTLDLVRLSYETFQLFLFGSTFYYYVLESTSPEGLITFPINFLGYARVHSSRRSHDYHVLTLFIHITFLGCDLKWFPTGMGLVSLWNLSVGLYLTTMYYILWDKPDRRLWFRLPYSLLWVFFLGGTHTHLIRIILVSSVLSFLSLLLMTDW